MALSGSTDFNMTAGEIVSFALKQCGIGLNSETATAQETNDALESLNMLMKAYSVKGLKIFLTNDKDITLVAAQQKYTLGAAGDVVMDRPNEIQSAYREDTNGLRTPMNVISREEYRMLSDPSAEGVPLSLYYDTQLTLGEMNIWPVPNATDAAEYTLNISWKKPADDADATTDDLEFPAQWYLALGWGLAKQLMVGYDLPKERKYDIKSLSKEALKDAEASDKGDNTSIYFQPNKRG